MGFNCGIVGLPNVGKSTLFNALTSTAAAEAANYPFCTIEPNVGRVSVPDERLEALAKIASSKQILPTQLEFVDIAGLVRGASKGEGLGNQFLGHIRSVDAIIHVLRCFEDGNITHVEDSVDPLRDKEIIEIELMLADLQSVEKRLQTISKKAKNDPQAKEETALCEKIVACLNDGKPVRSLALTADEQLILSSMHLISAKPMVYACNVGESDAATGNAFSEKVMEAVGKENAVVISAEIESQIAQLGSREDQQEFLSGLGLTTTGLERLIKAGYDVLKLFTFFTIGPKEARAWTVEAGATAPQAAGVIHTDFQRGFICAETISCEDYIKYNGETGAKEAGKARQEGRDYKVKDGDVFHFRFNV